MKLTINGKEAVLTDVNTCEQYVLAELNAKSLEVERLEQQLEEAKAERDAMADKAKELERKLGEEPGTLEAAVIKAGRASLFDSCTWATITEAKGTTGEPIPFRVWCEDCMKDYGRPKGVSVAEFVEYFEPEFRKEYEKKMPEGDE